VKKKRPAKKRPGSPPTLPRGARLVTLALARRAWRRMTPAEKCRAEARGAAFGRLVAASPPPSSPVAEMIRQAFTPPAATARPAAPAPARRKPGPKSALSGADLAAHLTRFPPGARDHTGKRLSQAARARMLGVSRWQLARLAPNLAR
jgi:hypothetical protein